MNRSNMVRMGGERVLLIGDEDRQIYSALRQALPNSQVRSVQNYFDAIAELSHDQFTLIFAAANPIERRPETAISTLRHACGDSRILLFAHPTLEPLSHKMLQFGCDDYLIAPVSPGEIMQA